ncbi:hypothetical protein, partial [Bartonella sp. CL50QHWL]
QSLLSVAGLNASDDYANFLTKTLSGKSDKSPIVNVLADDSKNLLVRTLDTDEQYKKSLISPRSLVRDSSTTQPFAENDENATPVNVSDFLRGGTAGMQRSQNNNVTLGSGINSTESKWGVFIGDDAVGGGVGRGIYGSVAIGYSVKAGSGWSTVIGYMAETLRESYGAVVLGRGAKTEGVFSIAIGGVGTDPGSGIQDIDEKNRVLAAGDYAMALGYGAKNYAEKGIVLGYNASAAKEALYSIAIGSEANTFNQHSIAIGTEALVEKGGSRGIAIGYQARVSKEVDSIAIGYMAHALGKDSIAIGSEYNESIGPDDHTIAKADYSTAVGAVSKALEYATTAIGHRAKSAAKNATALGFYSEATAEGSVALGSDSVSDRAASALGYTSLLQGPSQSAEAQWKSTQGAVSVGNFAKGITRQITGVAAGSEPTDAVNLGQLKDLEEVVRKNGWKLSVGGENGETVLIDDEVDFSAGSTNLTVTKGDKDNNIKFDLARSVIVDKIQTGNNILDATGLVISGGPKIIISGIDAGGKKITGVAKGTESTDAVNFSQLKDVKEQVEASSFVKQNVETRHISIGKETDGDKIDIANNKNEKRTLTGIKNGALTAASNEAVNGSQLFETNKNVTTVTSDLKTASENVVKYFGGGANYKDGAWTAPTFKLKTFTADGKEDGSKDYTDVGSAFAGIDTNFINVNKHLNTVVNNFNDKLNDINKEFQGDALLWSKTDKAFSAMRGEGKDRSSGKIKNLAPGDLTQNSEEAVNGGQLYIVGTHLANYLGGGADFGNGNSEGPTFKIKTFDTDGEEQSETYQNVADAFEGVNTALTTVQNKLTEQVNNVITKVESESFVQQDKTTHRLTIGAKVGGAEINIANESGADRIISGVGEAKNNNDAVNKSQLDSNIKNVNDNVTNKFSELTKNITNITQQVKGDALLWNDKANAFVARHEKSKEEKGKAVRTQENSRITFLLDGDVSKDSTDAVTGGQLYSLNEQLATYFGGGAGYDEQGQWKAPDFKIKQFGEDGTSFDKNYQNVADALSGVGTSITNVQNKLTEQVNNVITKVESESFIQQDKTTHRLTIGAKVGGAEINIANESGADRIISGVGEAKNNNDAVNKSQLDSNIKNVNDNVTNKFSELTKNITNITQQVKGDALLWNDKANAFVARHEKSKEEKGKAVRTQENSRITFLLDGDVSKDSTDAVTGGQLYSLNEQLATYFGGGAGYDKESKWKAPSFKVKTVKDDGNSEEKTYSNVADALAGVGNSFINIRNEISKEINNEIANVKGDSLVKKDQATNLITIGKEVEGSEINIANSSKADRTLSGVKAATKNNEAVNKAQLDKGLKDLSTSLQSDDSAVVHYDKQKDGAPNYMSITLGGKDKTPVALHNIAKGVISSESYDAINGQQINKIGGDIAKFLGGNAAFSNGAFSEPSYGVHDIRKTGDVDVSPNSHHNVGSALSALDYSLGNVNTRITNTINDFNKKITDSSQHIEKDALLWNGEANAFVAQHKTEEGKKENSKITSLADGSIVSGSSDAVTGGQINTIAASLSKILGGKSSFSADGTFTVPSYDLSTVSKDGEVTDKPYEGVEKAFKGLDTNIKTVNARIKEVSEGVAQDSLLWSNESNAFVAQHKTEEGKKENSKITSLAAGSIVSGSNDAVTGGQLHTIAADLSKILGGSVSFDGEKFKDPTYTVSKVSEDGEVTSESYNDVGSAFAGIGTNFINVNKHLSNEVKKFNEKLSNITQEVQGDALLWSDAEGAFVAQHGKEDKRASSKIKHLANGDVSGTSSDAVAGNQLYALGDSVAQSLGGHASYAGGAWIAPSFKIKTINEDGTKVEEKKYNTVSEAFEGVGTSFENLQKEFTQNNTEVTENIKQNALLWSDSDKAFVATHGEKESKSKITFLSNGEVSSSSSDAINGSQLFETNKTVATYLGGGAEYTEGKWTNPKFTVKTFDADGGSKDQNYPDVASALTGVGSSITNVKNEITKQINNEINNVRGDSLVKKDADTNLITIGKEVEGSEINIANKTGTDRTLSGVGEATKDNEAVNKGQLDASLKELSTSLQSDDSAVVHYDKKDGDNGGIDYTSVTLGKGKDAGPVALHNVKDGAIGESSHDAINGSQINTISQNVAKFLGGDAAFNNGAFTGPTYKLSKVDTAGNITNGSFDNVGSAFTGLDDNIKNVNARIKEVSEGVAQDSLNWSKEANAFVARHEKKQEEKGRAVRTQENSRITFLANGEISAKSTDAVTGSQLYSMNQTFATYFGGGAGYDKDGQWKAPNFVIKKVNAEGTESEESYKSVAEALSDISSSVTNVHHDVTNVVSESLVKQDDEAAPITVGKETNGTVINVANKSGVKRVISGVEDAKDNNDAVNKGQLDASLKELSSSLQSDDSAVVHYDKKDGDNGGIDYTSVTLGKGKDKAAVGLHNVADGQIAKGSHDAITGGQINKIGEDVAKFLGGEASFKDGALTQPRYKLSHISEDGQVSTSAFDGVGGAFEGLDANIKNVNQRIKEVSQGVAQDSLNWSKEANAFVAKHGTEGSNSKLKFLLDGDITANSTDAITGNQLYSMNQTVATYFGGGAGYENG